MKRLLFIAANAAAVVVFVGIGLNASLAEPGASSARGHAERQVTLYGGDEFNGSPNSPPSERLWKLDAGYRGEGGEIYTSDLSNVRQDGAGHLVITARRIGDDISTASITTYTRLEFDRGMIQARIRMPGVEGLRSELRLVGTSMYRTGPTDGGEVTVATSSGGGPIESALIGPWASRPHPRPQPLWAVARQYVPTDVVGDQYHIFWLRKETDHITIGIDDNVVADFTPAKIPAGGRWVFNQPLALEMSLSVEPENADHSLRLRDSAEMVVDWVRFYG